jgi:membrane-bound lytic murein transglycosylase D
MKRIIYILLILGLSASPALSASPESSASPASGQFFKKIFTKKASTEQTEGLPGEAGNLPQQKQVNGKQTGKKLSHSLSNPEKTGQNNLLAEEDAPAVEMNLDSIENSLFSEGLKILVEMDSSHYFDDPGLDPSFHFNANTDSLIYEWQRQSLLIFDENCRPTLTDSSATPETTYIQRLMDLPNIIEMPYNRIVRRFIDLYLNERRMQVEAMLGVGVYYFPLFEQILDQNGLPIELKYLPVIESALNPKAVSRVGATGLWQFMYATGKMYGLQINSLTDERRDPVKSTYAAVKYLKSLYSMFGDWNLAIAAYNCGPGNVNKAIHRSGGKRNFWEIYYYLPRETRSYVPLFIAANYVMTYYSEHGICPAQNNFPPVIDTFMIHQNMHFQQIAEVCQIPMQEIQLLNPHFRNEIAHGTASKAGILYLPMEYSPVFIELQDSIPRYKEQELLASRLVSVQSGQAGPTDAIVYRVKRGDNLSVIASRHNVSVQKLKNWNNLKSNTLQIGQRLLIY